MKKGECLPEIPAHIHAETTILGAILIDGSYYQKVVNRLEPEDFLLDSHQRIFSRMKELVDEGSAVDIVTLSECLKRHKVQDKQSELESIGGVAYLASLTEGLPLRLALKDYLRILREKRRLREIIGACSEATAAAYDAEPSDEIKERLWGKLHDTARESTTPNAEVVRQDGLHG